MHVLSPLLAFPTLQRNAVHSVGGISSQFLVEIIDPPRRAMNCRKTLMKSSVSSDGATSRCIARVVIHVKIHPYLLGVDRPCLINKGPNMPSIPT